MVQAEQLRQGNKLKFEDEIVTVLYITPDGVIIDGIDAADGSNIGLEQERLEYIPLDETWLERCGFGRDDFGFAFGKITIVPKGKHGYTKGRTYFNSWAILEHAPQYVHQLQNLFYALTSKELEIKQDQ